MSRVEELNQYIQELFDYWDGKNDDFEPIPIPKEVDDEMQRDVTLWDLGEVESQTEHHQREQQQENTPYIETALQI